MKQPAKFRTHSEEETVQLGLELAAQLSGVVLLQGDLGAGKTTLARGIVAGVAGAQSGEVSSPTFTLIHDYGCGVFHIDLYRLETAREIESLGLEDIFDQAQLVLVEWGEKLGKRAPRQRTEIQIEQFGGDERLITVNIVREACCRD